MSRSLVYPPADSNQPSGGTIGLIMVLAIPRWLGVFNSFINTVFIEYTKPSLMCGLVSRHLKDLCRQASQFQLETTCLNVCLLQRLHILLNVKVTIEEPYPPASQGPGPGGGPSNQLFYHSRLEGASTEYGDTGTLAAFIGHSSQGSLCLQKSQKSMIGKHKTYRINFLFSYIILIHFALTHFHVECKKYYLFR